MALHVWEFCQKDLSDDALPPSTNHRDAYIHGAHKFLQLGVEASGAILDGLTEGTDLSSVKASVFLDLHVKVGDFLEAFLMKRSGFPTSFFYYGVCENQVELDWVLNQAQKYLEVQVMDGKMQIPGAQKIEPKMPDDLLEPIPRPPTLNKLVLGGPDKNKLCMPVELAKQWQFHAVFGTDFTAFLNKFNEKYEVIESSAGKTDTEPDGTKNKRANPDPEPPKNQKKPKISQDTVMESNKISQALLTEVQLPGKGGGPFLQIRVGSGIYLTNKGSTDMVLGANLAVAGFGKGSFKALSANTDVTDKQHQFLLKSSSDMVVLNNVVTSLGQIILEKRESQPDISVNYHKIVPDEADPKVFTLEATHCIAFTLKEDGADNKDPTMMNIGAKMPFQVWNNQCLYVIWHVRFGPKGLVPVKPGIFLKGGVTVPVGHSCHCTACTA